MLLFLDDYVFEAKVLKTLLWSTIVTKIVKITESVKQKEIVT